MVRVPAWKVVFELQFVLVIDLLLKPFSGIVYRLLLMFVTKTAIFKLNNDIIATMTGLHAVSRMLPRA
jgi:hypothetical protein